MPFESPEISEARSQLDALKRQVEANQQEQEGFKTNVQNLINLLQRIETLPEPSRNALGTPANRQILSKALQSILSNPSGEAERKELFNAMNLLSPRGLESVLKLRSVEQAEDFISQQMSRLISNSRLQEMFDKAGVNPADAIRFVFGLFRGSIAERLAVLPVQRAQQLGRDLHFRQALDGFRAALSDGRNETEQKAIAAMDYAGLQKMAGPSVVQAWQTLYARWQQRAVADARAPRARNAPRPALQPVPPMDLAVQFAQRGESALTGVFSYLARPDSVAQKIAKEGEQKVKEGEEKEKKEKAASEERTIGQLRFPASGRIDFGTEPRSLVFNNSGASLLQIQKMADGTYRLGIDGRGVTVTVTGTAIDSIALFAPAGVTDVANLRLTYNGNSDGPKLGDVIQMATKNAAATTVRFTNASTVEVVA